MSFLEYSVAKMARGVVPHRYLTIECGYFATESFHPVNKYGYLVTKSFHAVKECGYPADTRPAAGIALAKEKPNG